MVTFITIIYFFNFKVSLNWMLYIPVIDSGFVKSSIVVVTKLSPGIQNYIVHMYIKVSTLWNS